MGWTDLALIDLPITSLAFTTAGAIGYSLRRNSELSELCQSSEFRFVDMSSGSVSEKPLWSHCRKNVSQWSSNLPPSISSSHPELL